MTAACRLRKPSGWPERGDGPSFSGGGAVADRWWASLRSAHPAPTSWSLPGSLFAYRLTAPLPALCAVPGTRKLFADFRELDGFAGGGWVPGHAPLRRKPRNSPATSKARAAAPCPLDLPRTSTERASAPMALGPTLTPRRAGLATARHIPRDPSRRALVGALSRKSAQNEKKPRRRRGFGLRGGGKSPTEIHAPTSTAAKS